MIHYLLDFTVVANVSPAVDSLPQRGRGPSQTVDEV